MPLIEKKYRQRGYVGVKQYSITLTPKIDEIVSGIKAMNMNFSDYVEESILYRFTLEQIAQNYGISIIELLRQLVENSPKQQENAQKQVVEAL